MNQSDEKLATKAAELDDLLQRLDKLAEATKAADAEQKRQLARLRRQDSFFMFCLYAVAVVCAVILMLPSSN